CGACDIGAAASLAEQCGYRWRTIQSFEDLMTTLRELKLLGHHAFIGSCCEAFYLKHRHEMLETGLKAVLIDIDSSTCYDLGKGTTAYEGNFSNQTTFNLDLLRRIITLRREGINFPNARTRASNPQPLTYNP
ncbi:hypothetical protein JW905_08900, partial [bacterium]|nr:hypothetical protein [candidate division CSSED10-310 bacterium]